MIIAAPFLDIIPRYFVFVALAAWLVAFLGLLWRMLPHRWEVP
jgi:hypothetical protein